MNKITQKNENRMQPIKNISEEKTPDRKEVSLFCITTRIKCSAFSYVSDRARCNLYEHVFVAHSKLSMKPIKNAQTKLHSTHTQLTIFQDLACLQQRQCRFRIVFYMILLFFAQIFVID